MIRTIGIDLGTTNTVAAHMKRGEPREIRNRKNSYLTPSALALTKKGELLVGEDARTRGTDIVMSFKRDLGTDKTYSFNKLTYTPMELSALVLRAVKKDVEKALGEPVLRAVITVPAWFNERAIVETREAGLMAGFFVVKTFSEPMAAALAYGIDREDTEPKTILVYDLGGGTFDISVLMVAPGSFAALDHEGDVNLGGDDFDMMILSHMRERLRKEKGINIPEDKDSILKLKMLCEQVKIVLSTERSGDVIVPALGSNGTDINVEITRDEFEPMIKSWLMGPRKDKGEDGKEKKSTLEHVRLAITNSDLTTDTIDNILLVGGSTCIPLVSQVLKNEFGEDKLLYSVNPMFCVADGAAIETALIHEIDCIKCHTKNELDATKCQKCGAPLIGEEKIDCPKCFMPSPAGATKCWKCGAKLGTVDSPVIATKKCPDGHENSINAVTCAKCGFKFEGEEIKCVKCGGIIKQSELRCPNCGAEKPVRTELTPKDIGIDLEDGRFGVIVPKNTNYPTESPIHKLFKTSQANATQMQIVVREGEAQIARENEWLGDFKLELPKGLPENTPVDVSIELDGSGSIYVSAKLVDRPLNAVSAFIERVAGGTQLLHEAEELQKKIKELKENASKEDQKALDALNAEIGGALRERNSNEIKMHKEEWEKQISNSESKAKENLQIENKIFWGEFTLRVAADYLDNTDKNKIDTLVRETKKARDSGNITTVLEKVRQLDDALESLGNIKVITWAEYFARHSAVSSATSSQLFKALGDLKPALRTGNSRQISQILVELTGLIEKAIQEVNSAGGDIKIQLPRTSDIGKMT